MDVDFQDKMVARLQELTGVALPEAGSAIQGCHVVEAASPKLNCRIGHAGRFSGHGRCRSAQVGNPDDPLVADRRNFFKVELWTRDCQHVERLLFAGNSTRPERCSLPRARGVRGRA
jgi:hypothetical protein